MNCPQCQYQLSPLDQECPRCHGKGLAAQPPAQQTQPLGAGVPPFNTGQSQYQPPNQPPYAHPAPVNSDDSPSFLLGLVGFLIPLVGLILFLVDKANRPQRARSAGIGALAGFACQILVVPMMFAAIMFPVFARAKANAERSQCQSHLKQLSLAAMQYAQDYKECYPDMSTPASVQRSLMPYMHSKDPFTCPAGHEYHGNPALSGKNMSEISNMATEVLFYETDKAHLEGSNVAYADGHVKWLRDSEWQALKLTSGLR